MSTRVTYYGSEPRKMSRHATGYDIALSEDLEIFPDGLYYGKTGIHLAVPEGIDCQIRARSSLFKNWGCIIPNAPATIDSDYRGEVMVLLVRLAPGKTTIPKGTRVAQFVFGKLADVKFTAGDLGLTIRGEGGFGSTGK